jgi:hypothetical protein
VLDRMIAAGISEDRIRGFFAAGAVRVDGQPVSDPATPAAPPCRIVIMST